MPIRNTIPTIVALLLALITLYTNGQSDAPANDGLSRDIPTYTLFTGPLKGTYQRIAVNLSNSCPTLNIQIVPSRGSTDNVNSLVQRPILSTGWRFAFVQEDVLTTTTANPAIRSSVTRVTALYRESIVLIVPRSANYTSIRQLVGRHVVVGSVGSGTAFTARQISESLGIPWVERELSQDQGVLQVLTGQADAAFVVGGTPIPLLSELGEYVSQYLTLLPLPTHPSIISKYPTQQLPAFTYEWLKHSNTVNTVDSSLIAASDVPPHATEALVRCMRDHRDDLIKNGHPKWKEIFSHTQLK